MNGGLATANQVRSGGKVETKAFANRECYKRYLIPDQGAQCSAEYLDLLGINYTQLMFMSNMIIILLIPTAHMRWHRTKRASHMRKDG